MRRPILASVLFVLAVSGGVLAVDPHVLVASPGTQRARCAQSLYVGLWSPGSVVHPGDLAGITVPVGVMPYAEFDTKTSCGHPTSSTLSLTGTFTPVGVGEAMVFGPVQVPLVLPTSPGRQRTRMGGAGPGEYGGIYDFRVPAGMLRSDVDWSVKFDAVYDVTFGTGIGAGTITATASADAMIALPSTLDAGFPLLNVRALSNGIGIDEIRKGDQITTWFLLENNDATRPLVADVTARGSQHARLPVASSDDAPIFSIGAPVAGDVPALGFAHLLELGILLDPPVDPGLLLSQIDTKVVLGPGEIRSLGVVSRGTGDAELGSARGIGLSVKGSIGATPVFGSASSLAIVSDVPGRSPLYEISTDVQIGPLWTADFTPVDLKTSPKLQSFAELFTPGNNSMPEDERFINRRAGILFTDFLTFGADGSESVRIPTFPSFLHSEVIYRKYPNLTLHLNDVQLDLRGLTPNFDYTLPVTAKTDAFFTQLRTEAVPATDDVSFWDVQLGNLGVKLQLYHRGSFEDAMAGDDPAVTVDPSTFLRMRGWDLPTTWRSADFLPRDVARKLSVDPMVQDLSVDVGMTFGEGAFDVGDYDFGVTGGNFTASLDQVTSTTANLVVHTDDPASIPSAPRTVVGNVLISRQGETFVLGAPFALRREADDAEKPLPIAALEMKFKTLFSGSREKSRDSAHLILVIEPGLVSPEFPEKRKSDPVPDQCREGVLDIGGLNVSYALDAKGKYRSADRRHLVKGKLLADGRLRLTVKLKKVDLLGPLSHHGFTNSDVPKPGRQLAVPCRVFACGGIFGGTAPVTWRSKRGKLGVAKARKAQ